MSVSMGVDVAEERKGLDIVALDTKRRVVATLDHATVADVKEAIADLRPEVVCIDSPPAWAAEGRSRAAERRLRRLGITAFTTPTDPGPHAFYKWMRQGFEVFDAIAGTHPRFREGPVHGTAVEVFPEASAVLLAGHLRPEDEPKARFRRRVLTQRHIDTAKLRNLDAVDAALGALTGLLALEGRFSAIGVPEEGVVVVPFQELPSTPLLRPHPPSLFPATAAAHLTPPETPSGERRMCECGCGAIVRRRFLPGHDAKLKAYLLRRRAEGEEAAERLQALGWN